MPTKVFISYSSRDRVAALALRKIVAGCDTQTWMDVFDISPAAELARELDQSVDSVDVLCLLLSPTAVASPFVRDEIARARAAEAKGVKVLPVLLRPTAIPDTLADLVAIDATRGIEEPSVALRLRQFFAGDVPEGVRLDAFNRAELADQEIRNDAETALPALRKELDRAWDQPLRTLVLQIDQDTWPDADGSVLEIVVRLDIFKGSAHVLVAPYVEGATWRVDSGFEERRPGEIGPHRVDARFVWAGRTLVLDSQRDGTDLGEQPIALTIQLDGSEVAGTERAASMQLATTFDLPSLRELVDKGSRIDLWIHPREGKPARVDPATTDLDLRLNARLAHDAIHEVCVWRSRHERTERVILDAPSLKACATDLEREVVLSSYLSRPLREQQNSQERKVRIEQLIERGETIRAEDRWAAAHLLRARADLAALRGEIPAAAEQYRDALNLMLEGFAAETTRFSQFDNVRHCARRLVQLLARKGTEQSLRDALGVDVDVSRAMCEAHAGEPEYRRALAEALLSRAEIGKQRFDEIDPSAVDEANALIDDLARRSPALPWRIEEARSIQERIAALRASAPKTPAPPVYARWLDPAAASREVPILCVSFLPRFSAKLPSRAFSGARQLHLVDQELIAVHGDLTGPGWFSAGCREHGGSGELSFTRNAVLARPPFPLLGLATWSVAAWDDAPTGDCAARWKVDEVSAARVLLNHPDGRSCRAYVVVAEHRFLRWTIVLGFRVTDAGVEALVIDDAEAALAFRSLQVT